MESTAINSDMPGANSGTRVENILKALSECLELNSSDSHPKQEGNQNHKTPENTKSEADQKNYEEEDSSNTGEILTKHFYNSDVTVSNGDVTRSELNGIDHAAYTNGDLSDQNYQSHHLAKSNQTNSAAGGTETTGAVPASNKDTASYMETNGIADDKSQAATKEESASRCPAVGKDDSSAITAGAAASGNNDDDEDAGESLLAKRLAVVMEKLEAYRATRDYMMALASRLKEENERFDAEHGTTAESINKAGNTVTNAATSDDHLSNDAEDLKPNNESFEKEADFKENQKSNDINLNQKHKDNDDAELKFRSNMTSSSDEPRHLNETDLIETNPRQTNVSESNITNESQSYAAINKPSEDLAINNAEQQKKTEAEDDDNDGDLDYDDYYDVSDNIDYTYEEDDSDIITEQTEANQPESNTNTKDSNNVSVGLHDNQSAMIQQSQTYTSTSTSTASKSKTADDSTMTDPTTDQPKSRLLKVHVEEPAGACNGVPDMLHAVQLRSESSKSDNAVEETKELVLYDDKQVSSVHEEQHLTSHGTCNSIHSNENGSPGPNKSDNEGGSQHAQKESDLSEEGYDHAQARWGQAPEGSNQAQEVSHHVPVKSNQAKAGRRFDLNHVERLNLMLRLQTEFAKMQLQMVQMQENMRTATAALQSLATLENGEEDQTDA